MGWVKGGGDKAGRKILRYTVKFEFFRSPMLKEREQICTCNERPGTKPCVFNKIGGAR